MCSRSDKTKNNQKPVSYRSDSAKIRPSNLLILRTAILANLTDFGFVGASLAHLEITVIKQWYLSKVSH